MGITITLLIKTTATQNEVALSYHIVRGLYFLAVVFVATIDNLMLKNNSTTTYFICSRGKNDCPRTL